jgi:S-adenosylmethionine hydrolase
VTAIVTLLSDFGTDDSYVAEVKGRLLSLAPGLTLVDVTHAVEPGDIAGAAFVLGRAWPVFPAGTVHLAVVDPGVGTARRALAAHAGGHWFVGPDNGVLDSALGAKGARVVRLAVPADAAPTFHGRDVFAPAAARLARGAPLEQLGPKVADPVRLDIPEPRRQGGAITGHVVYVDRFGTLVTNLPGARIDPRGTVRIGPHDLVVRGTFAEAAVGEPLALIGSAGMLEIAVRDRRADAVLGLSRGAVVTAAAKSGARKTRSVRLPPVS